MPDGGSYTINDPVNPVGVHTITNDHATDTVLVDAGGVLFVNDLYSPGFPSPDAEVVLRRVLQLGLSIDTVAGGHGGTIPWEDFIALFQ